MAVKKTASVAGGAGDLLAELAGMAAPAKKGAKKTEDRWELALTPDIERSFIDLVAAKTVEEEVVARKELAAGQVQEFCIFKFAEQVIKSGSKPGNPSLTSKKDGKPDITGIYIFQDKVKFRFPEVPEGVSAKNHYIDALVGVGLQKAKAEELVENELDFVPVVGLRPFNELTEGHYSEKRQFFDASDIEKSAGLKLLNFIRTRSDNEEGTVTVEALTPAELSVCLKRDNKLTIKAGFYDRLTNYVTTVDQLVGLFQLIVPICYIAQTKFGLGSTPEIRARRLVEAAADIVGCTLEE